MSDWIKFTEVDLRDGRKTQVWAVMTIDGAHCLGRIGWYSPWRKYCFVIPPDDEHKIFEEDCLRLIAEFCETETTKRREARKKQVAA